MAKSIRIFLKKQGYSTVESDYYAKIQEWEDWFKCTVDDFHKTSFFNGISNVTKDMKMLGMAKTVCEDFANLLMNEKVVISTGNDAQDKKLHEILKRNKFRKNANMLCELYFALGTGAFVEYRSKGNAMIDYIRASMIFPLTWSSMGIQECAFASKMHVKEGDCYYIQMHVLNDVGNYLIKNYMIMDDDEYGFKEIELPKGVEKVFDTKSNIPLFQILMPNIINNYDLENPMGLSIYANAIDVLKEIDNAFDSLDVEIDTGRRIVFLSSELFFSDEDGNLRNVVGEKEKILRYVGGMQEQMIKDFSPPFRTKDVIETIQFQLNLLSEKCGMGTNRYEFTAKGVKTATEVISEDSDLYQSVKKHEIILQEALENMIKALSFLSEGTKERFTINEINIKFDDSIIQDKDAERQQYKEEVSMGIMSPVEYRQKVYGEDEKTAQKMIPQAANVME